VSKRTALLLIVAMSLASLVAGHYIPALFLLDVAFVLLLLGPGENARQDAINRNHRRY